MPFSSLIYKTGKSSGNYAGKRGSTRKSSKRK